MSKIQQFGIKFPFTTINFEKYFVDTNQTLKDKVRSQLMHIVFTPKGQRIRLPQFGTDLIKYIFDPNDNMTWEAIKTEVSEAVSKWTSNIKLNNIQVVKNEADESEIYVRLDYCVTQGNQVTNDSVIVQI